MSGDHTYVVRCRQGCFVVKHWVSEDAEYAEKIAALQESLRLDGAPVPAHRRSFDGRFVEHRMTVQAFLPGHPPSTSVADQADAFGAALGRLDRSLEVCPVDPFFVDQSSVFSRCKDIDRVANRYLPACDGRFPTGYREQLVATIHELKTRLKPIANESCVLAHVDANPENVIVDDAGHVSLIDLTPEARHPGYSLGAALYWWAYPWRFNRLSLEILQAITRAYLRSQPLSPRRRRAIAAHMLNHSLMELAFPLGCLVDGPPPGARPLEDLKGRMRRADLLFAALDQIERAVMES